MSLTGKDVAEIARLLGESSFSSLDLKIGDLKLRIRRDGDGGGDDSSGRWATDEIAADPDETSEPQGAAGVEPAPAPPPSGSAKATTTAGEGEVDVVAPLLGNYYAAPRPGEDPFVQIGDTVAPDTIIAIIEVMKLMNSVRAGVSGIVTAVLPDDGSAVEKGQPIIRVKEV